jgi:hypothetical protein
MTLGKPFPLAPVLNWDDSNVTVQCPFCYKKHTHAIGRPPFLFRVRRSVCHLPDYSGDLIYQLCYPFESAAVDVNVSYEIDEDKRQFVTVGLAEYSDVFTDQETDSADDEAEDADDEHLNDDECLTEINRLNGSTGDNTIDELVWLMSRLTIDANTLPLHSSRHNPAQSPTPDLLGARSLRRRDVFSLCVLNDVTALLRLLSRPGSRPHLHAIAASSNKTTTPIITGRTSYGANCVAFAAAAPHAHDVLALLCDAGADVNSADSSGRTPLMHAALCGRLPAVDLLLARGANVACADRSERTALYFSLPHASNARRRWRWARRCCRQHRRGGGGGYSTTSVEQQVTNYDGGETRQAEQRRRVIAAKLRGHLRAAGADVDHRGVLVPIAVATAAAAAAATSTTYTTITAKTASAPVLATPSGVFRYVPAEPPKNGAGAVDFYERTLSYPVPQLSKTVARLERGRPFPAVSAISGYSDSWLHVASAGAASSGAPGMFASSVFFSSVSSTSSADLSSPYLSGLRTSDTSGQKMSGSEVDGAAVVTVAPRQIMLSNAFWTARVHELSAAWGFDLRHEATLDSSDRPGSFDACHAEKKLVAFYLSRHVLPGWDRAVEVHDGSSGEGPLEGRFIRHGAASTSSSSSSLSSASLSFSSSSSSRSCSSSSASSIVTPSPPPLEKLVSVHRPDPQPLPQPPAIILVSRVMCESCKAFIACARANTGVQFEAHFSTI